MAKYTCIWNGVQLKSKLQHDGNWWAAKRPLAALPCRLCYHPAVFFYDLRFTALSLPQKAIGAQCYCIVSFVLCGCIIFVVWFRSVWNLCADISEHCSIFIGGVIHMEKTVCSELSADKIQAPGKHPKERIQHSVQGECLNQEMLLSSLYFLITAHVWNYVSRVVSVSNGQHLLSCLTCHIT